MFGLMEVSTPKTGILRSCCGFLHQPKNITTIPYPYISTLLNANFDFDVSVANDVAIDMAKYTLPDKSMQWSPCPELRTLTNGNGRYMMKLNDCSAIYTFYQWRMHINININKKANLSRFRWYGTWLEKLHSFWKWHPKTGTRQIWRVIFIGATFFARRYYIQV